MSASELEEELTKLGIEYSINKNNPYEIEMRCFSGLHEDTNPSLHYNVVKEVFNCFSCGFRGNKRTMYEKLGIKLAENLLTRQGFKVSLLKNKLEKQIELGRPLQLPAIKFPVMTDFHGISAETLREFEAFTSDEGNLVDYVWFPLRQNNKLIGIEGRYRLLSADTEMPKYMRLPRGLNLSELFFPIDKIKDRSKIILVEGIFDMLKLWDLGVKNAVCLMGVNNFTYKKAKILSDYGCQHVTILLDGDTAGYNAAPIIKDLLTKNFIDSEIVKLESGLDPGAFTEGHLKTYLSKFILD